MSLYSQHLKKLQFSSCLVHVVELIFQKISVIIIADINLLLTYPAFNLRVAYCLSRAKHLLKSYGELSLFKGLLFSKSFYYTEIS